VNNAKKDDGNRERAQHSSLVLPEVTDGVTKQSPATAESKCRRGNRTYALSKLQPLPQVPFGIHHQTNWSPARLPRQPTSCLLFQTHIGLD